MKSKFADEAIERQDLIEDSDCADWGAPEQDEPKDHLPEDYVDAGEKARFNDVKPPRIPEVRDDKACPDRSLGQIDGWVNSEDPAEGRHDYNGFNQGPDSLRPDHNHSSKFAD